MAQQKAVTPRRVFLHLLLCIAIARGLAMGAVWCLGRLRVIAIVDGALVAVSDGRGLGPAAVVGPWLVETGLTRLG